jgi:hypothetical protein
MIDDINTPRVIDDDQGIITVTHLGKELRDWTYDNDSQRCTKMQLARDYVEGWCDGYHHMRKNADVIRGLHIRQRLRKVLSEFENTADVREQIVDRFWPKAKGD